MGQLRTVSVQLDQQRPDKLGGLLFALALAMLAVSPTQLTFAVKDIPLAPAEPVLAIAALVWALRWLTIRDTNSLPPLTHWLMVAAIVPGVFIGREGWQFSVLKETVQTGCYLLVAVTVFRAALTTPTRMRYAVVTLLAATTLAVALGIYQWGILQRSTAGEASRHVVFEQFTPHAYLTVQTPIEVCSTFGSWNEHGFHPSRTAYCTFLALVMPFALALLVTTRRRAMTIWLAVLFHGVAVSMLAGYVMPALLLGLLVTGIALGPRIGRGVALGILGYLLLLTCLPGINRSEILQEPFRVKAPAAASPDGVAHLKKFWGEQQAALNLVRTRPLFGVGAGQYQEQINQAYDLLGAVTSQRLEPDAQNGYLLTAASTGLLGLAALLALFGGYLTQAWRIVRGNRHPLAAAALGALAALTIVTLVTYPWVRGTSVVIALVLAMIGNGATLAPPSRMTLQEGNLHAQN